MPKPELQEFARETAVAGASKNAVGAFVELIEEEDAVYTYLFESKQKGYVGWRWSVTIFDSVDGPTVSEVLLMPGPDSLVAPKWVPWSERLADWKALQAELERQAAEESALAAEEGDDESEDEDSDDDDSVELEEIDEDEAEDSEESGDSDDVSEELSEAESEADADDDSAATDLEPGEDAEANTGKARSRIPRFIRRRGRRGKNKDND